MNILQALVSGPSSFRGGGVNEEGEAFLGALTVQALQGGRAALLGYVATLPDGKVVHTESTLLGTGPDGVLCLWPVMSEIPGVLPHRQIVADRGAAGELTAVFASGARGETASFREEITIRIDVEGSLSYAHAWGLPGGAFDDRSSCRMAPRAS